jgi:hypothetical protein
MLNDLSNNQNANSAYLCRHACHGVSMVQFTTEKDANLQQRVGSEKKFFDVLMSEMRSAGGAVQSVCNKCKSVAHTVSVSLVNIDEKLMENPNNLERGYESSDAFMRCLMERSDPDKPVWHQSCCCKTLVYDLYNSPLMKTGQSSGETICESIGRCPRCENAKFFDIFSSGPTME